MRVRQIRREREVEEPGKLPPVIETERGKCLTTVIFVKYNYTQVRGENRLVNITVAGLPNGMLQMR